MCFVVLDVGNMEFVAVFVAVGVGVFGFCGKDLAVWVVLSPELVEGDFLGDDRGVIFESFE